MQLTIQWMWKNQTNFTIVLNLFILNPLKKYSVLMKDTLKTKELIKISSKLNWLKKDTISLGSLLVLLNTMAKILLDIIAIYEFLFLNKKFINIY